MGKIESIRSLEGISTAGIGVASGNMSHSVTREASRAPLWEWLGPGQILELSGRAKGKLSTVTRLLLCAQAEGEPCAWISPRDTSCAYPPDLALAGIDFSGLTWVRVPPSAGPHGVVRASEILLRSGAFGLVVVELPSVIPRGELAWQSRLSGLLRMHDVRLVLLTGSEPESPSLGPMVGLRVEPEVRVLSASRVSLGQRVLKSKLRGVVSVSPDIRGLPVGARRFS